MSQPSHPFDAETWEMLPGFLDNLPEPVHIHIWGEENGSQAENAAMELARALAANFAQISTAVSPRRPNYPFYPVIGLMHGTTEQWTDKNVRIIGWPNGVQLTSLLTGIQAVSFQGMTLEAMTRIKIRGLQKEVRIELITSSEDEQGSIMAQTIFNLAVFSPPIRSFLIMAEQFPTAVTRYAVQYLPHTVLNGRVHIDGIIDEEKLLVQIATAAKHHS
jgi:alkyl hydroperoxide reductase subunit AhpF